MTFARHAYFLGLLSLGLAYSGVSEADATQSVAAGLNHSLAIKPDGTLWSWGYNNSGQLGIGSTVDQWFPAQVSSMSNVVGAAGGWYHSLAVKSDGTVWAWGYNNFGQLGDGTTTERHTPVQVSGLTNVIALKSNPNGSLALVQDPTVGEDPDINLDGS